MLLNATAFASLECHGESLEEIGGFKWIVGYCIDIIIIIIIIIIIVLVERYLIS